MQHSTIHFYCKFVQLHIRVSSIFSLMLKIKEIIMFQDYIEIFIRIFQGLEIFFKAFNIWLDFWDFFNNFSEIRKSYQI